MVVVLLCVEVFPDGLVEPLLWAGVVAGALVVVFFVLVELVLLVVEVEPELEEAAGAGAGAGSELEVNSESEDLVSEAAVLCPN